MEKALAYIREELLNHGELYLPNLGRFFLHKYNSSTNKFTKDARLRGSTVQFEFDPNAKSENSPDFMQAFTKQVVEGLNSSKTFAVGALGNFFINSSKQITFLASPKVNLSKETFGFTQVRVDDFKQDWMDWLNNPEGADRPEEKLPPIPEKKAEVQETQSKIPKPEEPAKPIIKPPVTNKPEEVKPKIETLTPEPPKPKVEPQAKVQEVLVKAQGEVNSETAAKEEKKGSNLVFKIVASFLLLCLAALLIYYGQDFVNGKKGKSSAVHSSQNLNETGNLIDREEQKIKDLKEKQKAHKTAEYNRQSKESLEYFSQQKGDFYVVGGSYDNANTGLAECRRWRHKGQTNVATAPIKGSTLFAVILGRFTTKQEAQEFANQVTLLDEQVPLEIKQLNIEYKK